MTEQFELGVGEKGIMIYDNNGPDDYYFIEDPKELQKFIKLINRQSFELKWYKDAYLEAHKLIMTSCSEYIRNEWMKIKTCLEKVMDIYG